MGLMDQVMADDAANLMDGDGFAEAVTYYPYGGASKSIKAIILRQVLQDIGQTLGGRGQQMTALVAIDVDKGVASVNVTVDMIGCAERYGGEIKKHTVAEVLGQSGGMWKLRLS